MRPKFPASVDEQEPDDLIEDEADGEAEPTAGAEETGAGATQDGGDSLTGNAAAASIRRSLAALSMLAEPGAPVPTSAAGAASLDAIVREMLRPMLAQWIDTHLPALVEREVKAEIARITGGAS